MKSHYKSTALFVVFVALVLGALCLMNNANDNSPFSEEELSNMFPDHCDTPLDELLETSDDFEIIHGLTLKIETYYEDIANNQGEIYDLAEWPDEMRVVCLVQYSKGLIDNGGFIHLLDFGVDGDPDLSLTIDSYEQIGNPEAADAIREVLNIVSGKPLPITYDSMHGDYLRDHASWDRITELNDTFYEADRIQSNSEEDHGRINRQLVEYIKAHREAYEILE